MNSRSILWGFWQWKTVSILRSMACLKQRSFDHAGHGGISMRFNMQPWNGWTGLTTGDYLNRLVMSLRQSLNRRIMMSVCVRCHERHRSTLDPPGPAESPRRFHRLFSVGPRLSGLSSPFQGVNQSGQRSR